MFSKKSITKKIIFFTIFAILHPFVAHSQEDTVCFSKIYDGNVATMTLKVKNKRLSYPVIELNSQEKLILEFDDFREETRNLSYTFIHCTPDWQPSDLMQAEYIDGLTEDEIRDFEISFNTLKDYNHYKVEFPGDNCVPTLSGNYIIKVFDDYDRDNVVLTARFRIVEKKVLIKSEVQRSTNTDKLNSCTQFKTQVKITGNEFGNYSSNGLLYILRNNDDNFAIHADKPDYIKGGNVLEYNNPLKYSLEGGNEFRYINLKDSRMTTDKVASIDFIDPYYLYTIFPEKSSPHLYAQGQDVNGRFVITAEGTENPDCEADYVLVDFTFITGKPFLDTEVYLYGDISNNQILPENKMEYVAEYKAYRLRKLLKQGFYNYWYVLHDPLRDEISLDFTEGNFYKTENEFTFYFYFKNQGEVYYRLLGYEKYSSH